MTDEQIVAAVRSGEFTLVRSSDHAWDVGMFEGRVGVFVELDESKFECEEAIGLMMGGLTKAAQDAQDFGDDLSDDMPF